MTEAVILARLQEIVTDWKGEGVLLTAETPLAAGLVEDSVEMMELVLSVEDAFGIEISDEVVDRLVTVGDVIRYIQKS